jgi:hemerythrin-like domain-containing protein
MDILHLIEVDHRKVAELFQKLHNTRGAAQNRQQLFAEMREALELHTQAEEQVFYPALQEADEARDLVRNAQADHQLVAELLEEMASDAEQDADWDEKLDELQENVEGHIDEEEDELFDMARQVLSAEQARKLAEEWQRVKQEQQMARLSP